MVLSQISRDTLSFLGITIALFGIGSTIEAETLIFWVTNISAIFFGIFTIAHAILLIIESCSKK